jgi:hypothetical protein
MPHGLAFKVILAIVCLLTVASFAISGLLTQLSAVLVYDNNLAAMRQTLSPDQAAGISRAVRSVTTWITWPLFISNVCWIGLFVFSYRQIRRQRGTQ